MVNGDTATAIDELARLLGPLATRDAPLGARTTYRVGGTAALLVEADDEAALVKCHEALSQMSGSVPLLIFGRGSNLLVADAGFPGLAITLAGGFVSTGIEATTVRAGGASGLQALGRETATAGLTGFEWAVGVPESVGGAVRMNAGGHGSEMSGVLVRRGSSTSRPAPLGPVRCPSSG